MFPLLGLCGVARSGKSHLGRVIVKNYDLLSWAFAHPLKMRHYSINDEYSLDDIFGTEDKPKELRKALQIEGTENGRKKYREDIWLRSFEAMAHIISSDWPSVSGLVLTDVRFPNEADFIKSHGGIVLSVYREGSGLKGSEAAHSSESLVGSIKTDGTIDNTDFPSEEDLLKQLDPYIKKLGVDKR